MTSLWNMMFLIDTSRPHFHSFKRTKHILTILPILLLISRFSRLLVVDILPPQVFHIVYRAHCYFKYMQIFSCSNWVTHAGSMYFNKSQKMITRFFVPLLKTIVSKKYYDRMPVVWTMGKVIFLAYIYIYTIYIICFFFFFFNKSHQMNQYHHLPSHKTILLLSLKT